MKISVIIPTYNSEEYIVETIESLNAIQYPDLEVIFQDCLSSDDTVEIIKRDSNFKYKLISELDKGQADAINRGFNKSSGEIVTWLNSDDIYISPDILKHVNAAFENNHPDIVYGGYDILAENSRILDSRDVVSFSKSKLIYGENYIPVSAFIKRDTIDEIGYLDVRYDNSFDYEYWCRCASRGKKFYALNKNIYGFRLRKDSKTVGNNKRSVKEKKQISHYYKFTIYNNDNKYLSYVLNLYYRLILIFQTGNLFKRFNIKQEYFNA